MAEEQGPVDAAKQVHAQTQEAVKRSLVARAGSWINENIMPAAYAFTRQGAKEIAQVLPAFPDSVKPVEELGTLGNPTQLTVNQENGVAGLFQRDHGYEEWLDERAKEAARQPEREDYGREL